MSQPKQKNPFDPQSFARNLTNKPGVYRMVGANGEVLYVGKARNLKKRVASYFRRAGLPPKTRALMEQVERVEVTVTHTEGEALILENNLIKELHPRYNVLLRDDKSYPYIYLSTDDEFPRLAFHRGPHRAKGRYFGPYPNAGAVRETLSLLQKLFPVRQCEDSFFRNRSRPCLQYQIKRCTAPCVGYVDRDTYMADVHHAEMFLEGKSSEVIDELVRRMEKASEALDFELAARYRDQITSLRRVQERQYVSGEGGDLDVVACAVRGGSACVQVFFIRAGRNLGNKTFFPQIPEGAEPGEVLASFLPQYYLGKEVPQDIVLSHRVEDQSLVAQVLTERAGRRVSVRHGVRGERARWLEMALDNAEHALQARLASRTGIQRRLEALQEALELEQIPTRIECFDISHTMGEATVASCVVFEAEGPVKSDYRRFNITDITPGDDYGALRQALQRRYTRLKKGEGKLPDVLLIDGGKGQVRQAREVLEELQVEGVVIVGVAKGPERRPGEETLFLSGRAAPFILPRNLVALHLIQQVRDEAHRFAVTGHRQRRSRARSTSVLESIPGMGPKRRQRLLQQFGGLREIARAGVEDLASVQGISRDLAQKVYDAFHSEAS
ncbi:MAG: excinuclease ABC subunit UvrC [Gammaproteobacteria bacterium]|nr:excinuclease ABC subunit UvrC [Gammaproteobacteria bacterium]NIR97079.1 excinuclease ABC subunit UvrC [Gammaproteobacteria bacterium]NIT62781.1 excinuclease ABC subunit UvrC [Gammaproteobacteria bacterium]NIV19744.1 excinuclease ABC subunit UvrC [Gammaproteobacteria bacterium]NIX11168.1 excinuclease ABC subunit UvrC [Gammaproteobacteria bacterium]